MTLCLSVFIQSFCLSLSREPGSCIDNCLLEDFQHKRLLLCATCRYEELGAEGFHSLYRWYQRFEAQHFPDPAGLRELIAKYTLHIYPGVVKAAMALYDVPEAIAVTRTAMCAHGVASLSRLQVHHQPLPPLLLDPSSKCTGALPVSVCGASHAASLHHRMQRCFYTG